MVIAGMVLVKVHTLGRVHYMLVEGLSDARSWAAAIDRYSGDEGRGSPQDEVRKRFLSCGGERELLRYEGERERVPFVTSYQEL